VRNQVRRHAAARGELRAALAQIGETQHCIDEVFAGRQFQRVHARARKSNAQLSLAPLRGLREALAEEMRRAGQPS